MIELFKYTEKEQKQLLDSLKILIDTREKENKNNHIIDFFDKNKIPWEYRTLTHGDYSFEIPKNDILNIPRNLLFTNKVCIERKASLSEWANNLVQDRQGVKKKFALAPMNTLLLIENATYEDMILGNYYGNYSPKSYSASFHSIWNEFDIPIILMNNKTYTGMFIYGHFKYYLRNLIK